MHRQLINLGPAPVEVRADQVFTFAKADESATLTLTTGAMSLESRKHEHREQLFDDVRVGLDALLAVCGPIATTRLGLRYVNVVDREQIADGLARATSWENLITNRFHAVPAGLADPGDTLFACEVASPMAAGGAQTARYGLIRNADSRIKFRLDIDRYVEGTVDPKVVASSLNAFADDVFAVFIAAAGPDLLAWMSETKGET